MGAPSGCIPAQSGIFIWNFYGFFRRAAIMVHREPSSVSSGCIYRVMMLFMV